VAGLRSGAWLQAMPCKGPFDLTLEPDQMQVCLQHRLGQSLASPGQVCPLRACGAPLDVLGHHHLTCKLGGYPTVRHNRVRDGFFSLASLASMSPRLEKGAHADDLTRPADVLLPCWALGKAAAFDVTVVSPLTSEILSGAGDSNAVAVAEALKHSQNDPKCAELGWRCIPLAVDSYGSWGVEAHQSFLSLADRLATRSSVTLGVALSSIYNLLGVILARQNATAILARRCDPLPVGSREVRLMGHCH